MVAISVLVGVAVAILYPLYRPSTEPLDAMTGPLAHRAALEERREVIYAAIRELGFDYRTDKLTTADYEDEIASLKSQAMEIVAAIEKSEAGPAQGPEAIEELIASERLLLERDFAEPSATGRHGDRPPPTEDGTGKARFCTQCGRRAGHDDRFCAGCGDRLRKSA